MLADVTLGQTRIDQGTQRGQIRITDIHVTANMQRSLRHLPAYLLEGAWTTVDTTRGRTNSPRVPRDLRGGELFVV